MGEAKYEYAAFSFASFPHRLKNQVQNMNSSSDKSSQRQDLDRSKDFSNSKILDNPSLNDLDKPKDLGNIGYLDDPAYPDESRDSGNLGDLDEGQEYDGIEDLDNNELRIAIDPTDPILRRPNDTIPQAIETGLSSANPDTFSLAGAEIGNNTRNPNPPLDVDMFQFQLDAGDRVRIDIDANDIGSSLDSVLQVFDESGFFQAFSESGQGPGEGFSNDPYLEFTAPTSGNYYAAVSGSPNYSYNPFVEQSGTPSNTTGEYNIEIALGDPGNDVESNDTIFNAIDTGLSSENPGTYNFTNAGIGNNTNVPSGLDVDLYKIQLEAGDTVEIDIDARVLGSELDSVLRLFDSKGNPIEDAFSDDAPAPGEDFTLDSYIKYTAPFSDTFYVGVSGYRNFDYNSRFQGSGTTPAFRTGEYDIGIAVAGNVVFPDPSGDTFGFGSNKLDIKSVKGSVKGENLVFKADFFNQIAAPSTGLSESVVGYIDLDLDQNSATGQPSFQSFNAPPGQQGGPLGSEVFIDLYSEQFNPGFVNLVDRTTFNTIGQAPISYGNDSFEIQVPLDLLNDDGALNYSTVLGNFSAGLTDAAPDTEVGVVTPSGGVAQNPVGSPFNDILTVVDAPATIFGGDGDDLVDASSSTGGNRLYGGNGKDELYASTGDRLFGEAGDDILDATVGTGNNRLYGGEGRDILFAGSFNDQLFGNNGNDTLYAGNGGNTLTGGDGSDLFQIASAGFPSFGNTVTDFKAGIDKIGISGLGIFSVDSLTLAQSGTSTRISAFDPNGGFIREIATLNNVQASSLDSSNFLFA